MSEASERPSEFADLMASVAHDQRGLLNKITASAALLGFDDRVTRSPENKECIDAIRDAARAIASMIDDVLHLAQLHVNQTDWEPENVALQDLLDDALRVIERHPEVALIPAIHQPAQDIPAHVDTRAARGILTAMLRVAAALEGRPGSSAVHLEARDDAAVVRIDFVAPSFDPEFADTIFDGRWERHRTVAKPGLPTAIYVAREIAKKNGGALDLEPRAEPHSFSLTLRLPTP